MYYFTRAIVRTIFWTATVLTAAWLLEQVVRLYFYIPVLMQGGF
ncbi:MAG TPA: hypothetical protein VK149_04200 [Sideroxyarcus sp.]|nr:hypothetical protein [Sideroxyarcus sp.]